MSIGIFTQNKLYITAFYTLKDCNAGRDCRFLYNVYGKQLLSSTTVNSHSECHFFSNFPLLLIEGILYCSGLQGIRITAFVVSYVVCIIYESTLFQS